MTTHNINFGNLEGGSLDPVLVVTDDELAHLLKSDLVQVLPVSRRTALLAELAAFGQSQDRERW